MKYFILILVLLCNSYTFAWNENTNASPRARGIAGAGVCLKDPYALSLNQAGIVGTKGYSLATSFESRFISSGISNKALFLSANYGKTGAFGLAVNSYGLKNYSENKIGLAYARSFGEKISLGMQLNYMSTVLGENYGKSGTVSAEVGIQAAITNNISIGAHLFNPTKVKISSNGNEFAPTVLKFGFLYKVNAKLFITSEAEKSSNVTKPVIKAGVEYNAIKGLYFRAGVSGNPMGNTFGVGYYTGNLKADVFVAFNSRVGYSSGIGLAYVFKTNNQEVTTAP